MRLLYPDDLIDHVTQLTPAFAQQRDLRGLLLDLDNTLVPYGSYQPVPEIERWLEELRAAGLKLSLLSNATRRRAEWWLPQLKLSGLGLAGKPNPGAFRRGAEALGLTPAQVGMVGDQLFTDVLGGNLAGLHTILVRPLADNALPHTRLARQLERLVLRRRGERW